MYYILYNPTSCDGKANDKIDKLYEGLSKLDECYKLNLLEITNKEVVFLNSLQDEDIVYLCGGDGTLNFFLNKIGETKFKCKIFFYGCGSGNDFKRDYKNDKYIDLGPVREYISKCIINGEERYYFVNGIGIGLDAVVCRSKMQQNFTGRKKNYFGIALASFKKFRPYSLDAYFDGEIKHFDNVWLLMCNNGRYVGGGMKVCPNAIRDDGEFDVVIIHDIPRWKIILLFPLIYLGWHKFIKGVEYVKCRSFRAVPDGCTIFEMDGETLDYVREVKVES